LGYSEIASASSTVRGERNNAFAKTLHKTF